MNFIRTARTSPICHCEPRTKQSHKGFLYEIATAPHTAGPRNDNLGKFCRTAFAVLALSAVAGFSQEAGPAEGLAARAAGIFDAKPFAGNNQEGAAVIQEGTSKAAQIETGGQKNSEDIIIVKKKKRRRPKGLEGIIDRFLDQVEDQIAITLSALPALAATGVIRWANKAFFNVLERWIPMAAFAASPFGTILGVALIGLALGFFLYWILSGDDRKPIPKEKKQDDQKKYNRIANAS